MSIVNYRLVLLEYCNDFNDCSGNRGCFHPSSNHSSTSSEEMGHPGTEVGIS